MCWSCWAAFASQPPTLVEHSNLDGLSTPMLGPFPRSELKKSLHGRGWCFQWREVWEASSAHNLAMLPVGCQFKNSSAKRGCALLGNPKVSSASIQSRASMDNSTSGVRATFKRGFGRRCAPVPHGYDRIWCISWSSARSRGGQA